MTKRKRLRTFSLPMPLRRPHRQRSPESMGACFSFSARLESFCSKAAKFHRPADEPQAFRLARVGRKGVPTSSRMFEHQATKKSVGNPGSQTLRRRGYRKCSDEDTGGSPRDSMNFQSMRSRYPVSANSRPPHLEPAGQNLPLTANSANSNKSIRRRPNATSHSGHTRMPKTPRIDYVCSSSSVLSQGGRTSCRSSFLWR